VKAASHRCDRCGDHTTNSYRLCDDCLADRVIADRAAHGLPPTITDAAALDRVAAVLAASSRRAPTVSEAAAS
jgi:hypothetical protein